MSMKKLLALLLALIMVFALAACGDDVSNDDDDDDDDDKESTSMSSDPTGTSGDDKLPGDVGGVEDPKDPPPAIDSDNPVGPVVPSVDTVVGLWETAVETTGATMGVEGFNGAFTLVIDLTFDADGDYLMDVNEDKTVASMDAAFDKALADYVFDSLISMVGSEEEADALCQDQYGVSSREFAESSVAELKGMLQEMMVEMVTVGEYELEGGKLYMDDAEVAFTKEGETMKLSTSNLEMENVGAEELVFQLVSANPQDINPEDYDSNKDLLPVGEAIVGAWECLLALEGEDMGLEGFEGLLFFDFTFTFNADGTYTVTIDKDALIESAKEFEAEMVQYSVDLFFAQMETSGMSREEAAAAAQEYYGMTIQEYFQQEVAKQNIVETMSSKVEQMNGTGTYTVDGNKLTMDGAEGDPVVYTVEQMSNDVFMMDSEDEAFNAMMTQFGEECMVLFREK